MKVKIEYTDGHTEIMAGVSGLQMCGMKSMDDKTVVFSFPDEPGLRIDHIKAVWPAK